MNQDVVKKNFSKAAVFYDEYAKIQKITAQKLIEKSVILSDGLKINHILEIGSGTGIYTQLLHASFPDAKITALDFSSSMNKIAKSKIKSTNIEFITENIMDFKANNKFDLITANATLHWLPDLDEFLSKCKKKLTGEGAFLFSYFGAETCWELNSVLRKILNVKNFTSSYFLERNSLYKMMKKHFQNIFFEENLHKEQFDTVLDLLKTIKYTGTRGLGLKQKIWTSDFIQKVESEFLIEFEKVEITYQVFYVAGKLGQDI
ncbi:MAG: methyltransferase domain-containing protein [Candidatus Margulisiibacteriota bacterium]